MVTIVLENFFEALFASPPSTIFIPRTRRLPTQFRKTISISERLTKPSRSERAERRSKKKSNLLDEYGSENNAIQVVIAFGP
ncbi:hypothetical protein KM043_000672 [Ampulex compressa]|nr:hypothetical protein KM043_000672 [Ampulex compressa]